MLAKILPFRRRLALRQPATGVSPVGTLKGLYIYVWQPWNVLDGTLETLLARAKAAGCGLIWKSDDGGNWYANWITIGGVMRNVPVSELVARCEAVGVPAGCWGYWYGYDAGAVINGYTVSGWQQELQRAVETVQIAKPRFYAADNEVEYEAQGLTPPNYQRAQTNAQGLRQAAGADYPLISACLPLVRYHLNAPYRQFADASFIQGPQCYWPFWRGQQYGTPSGLIADWQADCAEYQIPLDQWIPTYCDAPGAGQQYASTDGEITEFLASLDPKAVTSIWAWDAQHMDDDAWARATRVVQWLRANDPEQKATQLLSQANDAYGAANALLAQAAPLLLEKAS